MRIAITGSDGFVGRHLIHHLKEHWDFELIEIDLKNGIDVCNREQMQNVKPFYLVIHLANKIFVPESYKNPYEYYYVNFLGTLNTLELCRLNNARMIFISSYVYGNPEYLPIDERHPIKSFNPYCNTKIIGENLCKGYFEDFNVNSVIIRPFNLYGLGQNENFLIPSIINQIKSGRIELNDPRPKRDLLYIDDFVQAIIKILNTDFDGYDIYNLGSGVSLSVEEIVSTVKNTMDSDAGIIYKNIYRSNEVMDTVADISKISTQFGWKPIIDFKNGIKKMLLIE